MIRVHKIRLVPNLEQEIYFRKACGVARFAYNWALAEWKRQYESGEKPNETSLRKQLNAIKAEQFQWMSEVTKCAPQQAIKNVGLAFNNFFRRVKLKQKPGFPKFKKKGVRDSFRADNGPENSISNAVKIKSKFVWLPKIGKIRMREELRFNGRVISATVSRMADGWYVALSVETEDRIQAVANNGVVGVDLGISNLATFSDGKTIPQLKPHRAAHKRLVRLSRSLSRKQKGSANRTKAKTKLARLHLRISNVRKDALHKLTYKLVTEYSTIGIEDLNVSGMMRNRHLARSIADSSFYEFRRQLEYKSTMTGTDVVLVDRFFPSSKTCSDCGMIHDMPLDKRRMVCECGCNIDRDLNAAKNIKRQALAYQSVERVALASTQVDVKLLSMKQKISSLGSNAQTI